MAKLGFSKEVLYIRDLNIIGGEPGSDSWEIASSPAEITATREGLRDGEVLDRHYGYTRTLRPYEITDGWSGRVIANDRQAGIVDIEDLEAIMFELGIYERLSDMYSDPVSTLAQTLGANIVMGPRRGTLVDIGGAQKLLVPGTRLCVGENTVGAMLEISQPHLPCAKAARAICSYVGWSFEEKKSHVKASMQGRRGYMARIIGDGILGLDDNVHVQPPIEAVIPESGSQLP